MQGPWYVIFEIGLPDCHNLNFGAVTSPTDGNIAQMIQT